jgi:NodT family efflux transporter outer membrane factor (OMF) lipoprotein
VSYALDVFGGEHRMIENLQSQVEVQRAVVKGAYIALAGNIVNTAIALAAYRDEIVQTRQLIDMQREEIAIAEKQVRAGIVPYANLLNLKSQLASLEATLPPLQQKLSQSEHLLATLAGYAPAQWQPPEISMDKLRLPDALPLSFPSQLVQQRPDIMAAEASMHAASANIGVAAAAQFPSFTLDATFGQNSTTMNSLMKSSSNFWGIGPNVTAPLFDGGMLVARKQGAIDAYRQSQALYRQTVNSAFSQVADILRALENDAKAQLSTYDAMQSQSESLHLVRINYQAGTVNYLQVLSANMQYQQAKIAYMQALAERLQDTAAFLSRWEGRLRRRDERSIHVF